MSQPVSNRDRQRKYRENHRETMKRLGITEYRPSVQLDAQDAQTVQRYAESQNLSETQLLTGFLSTALRDRCEFWRTLLGEGET